MARKKPEFFNIYLVLILIFYKLRNRGERASTFVFMLRASFELNPVLCECVYMYVYGC